MPMPLVYKQGDDPSYLPPGPPNFNSVQWAPAVVFEDAKLAYKFWSLPDAELGEEVKKGSRTFLPEDQPEHALARNVYEHLNDTRQSLGPITGCYNDKLAHKKWSYEEVFGPGILVNGKSLQDREFWTYKRLRDELSQRGLKTDGRRQDLVNRLDFHERLSHDEVFGPHDFGAKDVVVNGKSLQDRKFWTVKRLRDELSRRGLKTNGGRQDLERRLYADERHRILPRTDLQHWGINRDGNETKHAINFTPGRDISTLDMYTSAIQLSPYNPAYWLSRAYCHYRRGFFDLAIGDAYRALLLCEILSDPDTKWSVNGLDERISYAVEQHITAMNDFQTDAPEFLQMDEEGVASFIPTIDKAVLNVITLSLLALQCWDDYDAMERFVVKKFNLSRANYDPLQTSLWTTDMQPLFAYRQRKEQEDVFRYERRTGGCLGGRKYPYEAGDKDRYTKGFLSRTNDAIARTYPWKKYEVGVRSVAGDPSWQTLGTFATQPIKKDEIIFTADPSVRGHLSINRILPNQEVVETQDVKCDNCGRAISFEDRNAYRRQVADDLDNQLDACLCFSQPVPIYFCPKTSESPGCAQDAQERYHYQACRKNWQWLHDAMRPVVCDTSTKPYFSHTNEDHGTIMSLLLRDVFDMTLQRRDIYNDPNLMAHEMDELLILESHHDWPTQYFPFTFVANIQVPFDILISLGVDPFSDLTFDTWVIQTVLNKLYVNVIPGNHHRREPVDPPNKDFPPPDEQDRMVQDGEDFSEYNPTFPSLYLFPGLSMFNHACWGAHNATWGYDDDPPNRVIVWAAKDIQAGEEICMPYLHPERESEPRLREVLGQACFCTKHQNPAGKRKLFQTDLDPAPERPHKRSRTEMTSSGLGRIAHSYNLRSRKRKVVFTGEL